MGNGEQNWQDTWPPEGLLDPDTVPRLLAVQFELQTGQDDAIRRLVRVPQSYRVSETANED